VARTLASALIQFAYDAAAPALVFVTIAREQLAIRSEVSGRIRRLTHRIRDRRARGGASARPERQ
jgi:hypothetical protein